MLAQQKAQDAAYQQQLQNDRRRLQNSQYRNQIGNINAGQLQSILNQNGIGQ